MNRHLIELNKQCELSLLSIILFCQTFNLSTTIQA